MRGRLVGAVVAAVVVAASAGFSHPIDASTQFSSEALPGHAGDGANQDAEPGAALAPDGTIWATALRGVTGAGQDVWRSDDGGTSWQWVAAPFNVTDSNDTPLAGDDADIAVASERNASGSYNVYIAGLASFPGEVTGVEQGISLAISRDAGATWVVHPLAAEIPFTDRPWLAADGPCRVYLNYHAGPTVANVVNTYDLCDPVATVEGQTLTPIMSTRYPDLLVPAATGQTAPYVTVGFGKLAVDTSAPSSRRHALYVPMMDCPDTSLAEEIARAAAQQTDCPGGRHAHVFVAVGTNDATSWSFHDVAESSSAAVPVWPATVAVDEHGRVFIAWHDNRDAFVQRSDDGGATWTAPVSVNTGGTAVYPTVAAAGGFVDVSWYGTDTTGDANDPNAMGAPGAPGATQWSVRWARSKDGGATFQKRATADPLVHTGALCTKGTACTIPNSRSLLDDFAAVIDPATGRAVIVYTTDQPGGTSANRSIRAAHSRTSSRP